MYVHTCMQVCFCARVCICACVSVFTYMHVSVCDGVYIYVCVHVHACVFVCACAFLCVCVHVCVRTCMHAVGGSAEGHARVVQHAGHSCLNGAWPECTAGREVAPAAPAAQAPMAVGG